jgi:hypothetical protein
MSGEIVRSTEAKRKRGAPKGNQNARKHGFYSSVLAPEQKEILPAAGRVGGLRQEIAMLRTQLKSLLAKDPDNLSLMTDAVNSLARMLHIDASLKKTQKKTKHGRRSI